MEVRENILLLFFHSLKCILYKVTLRNYHYILSSLWFNYWCQRYVILWILIKIRVVV